MKKITVELDTDFSNEQIYNHLTSLGSVAGFKVETVPEIDIDDLLQPETPKTASDWQLFSDMVGAEAAAAELTEVILDAHKAGHTAKEAWDYWCEVSDKYAKLGAADTEPRTVATILIEKLWDLDDRTGDWRWG